LIADEPLASLVRDAFEGFASGRFQTQAEIKRFFEAHPDFPRSKHGEVKQKRVTDILNQPLFAGYICSETYGLNWLKGQHQPLISLETFDKAQKRLRGTALAPARKNIGESFSLRGFVTCGDCNVPLRSSWSKGKYKHYLYYLCQTKGCASYGKSIPRDKVEGAFGEVIKSLEPSPTMFALAKTMFHAAWEGRSKQVKDAKASVKRQIAEAEKQIDSLLARIINATNDSVIGAYEEKIARLEKSKVRLQDSLIYHAPKQGRLEEMLEHSLQFLANPCKPWDSGNIVARRILLRLAFVDRFAYHRIEGARTPELSIPFKVLGVFQYGEKYNGAAGEN
jgi:hypothetical protein